MFQVTHRSLSWRLAVIMGLGCAVVLFALGVYDWVTERARIVDVATELGQAAAKRLTATLGRAVYQVDEQAAREALAGEITAASAIAFIVCWEVDGSGKRSLFCGGERAADGTMRRSNAPAGDLSGYRLASAGLLHGPQLIGTVEVFVSRAAEATAFTELTHRTVVRTVAVGVSLLVILLISVRLMVVRPLRQAAEDLQKAAQAVAQTATEVSQQGALAATSSRSVQHSVAHSTTVLTDIDTLASTNARHAGEAQRSVAGMVGVARTAATSLARLGEAGQASSAATRECELLTGSIQGIALQTRILALNAAVEAARHGAAGGGFRVIAREVQALNARVASAARDSAARLAHAVGQAEIADAACAETTLTNRQLTHQLASVEALVQRIANGAEAQRTAMGAVRQALGEMRGASGQSATAADTNASSAAAQAAQAERLRQIVSGLERLIDGG